MIENFSNSFEFSGKIRSLIPAGAHTYSKADDQFPYLAPKGIVKGKGVFIWDVDGNKYLDWTMGLTAVSLGHAYPPVLKAVRKQLAMGVNFQRPSIIELEFAELLKELFPHFDMFKFAKNGSTVTTAAVKLARAYTGRDIVAVCADHPFFSYDDWFIGKTECSKGVPEAIRNLTVTFRYNNIKSVKDMFDKYRKKIACIILEPVKHDPPEDNFLHELKKICHDNGTVFILDEMITGFRFHLKGAQKIFNIEPDMATFGKGVANGFSVAFLAGKRDLMKLGGIDEGTEKVFLVSTTHGAETHSLAAAIATINEIKEKNVIERNWKYGSKIINMIKSITKSNGISDYIEINGYPCLPAIFCRDYEKKISNEFKTLFMQEMIRRGILIQSMFTVAYLHGKKEMEYTADAFNEVCKVYAKALERSSVDGLLVGPPVKPVFRKIN